MDDADIAEERARLALEADVKNVRKPGECALCGEWSARRGACAPCRDRFKLG